VHLALCIGLSASVASALLAIGALASFAISSLDFMTQF
jgi:hypothetical protein